MKRKKTSIDKNDLIENEIKRIQDDRERQELLFAADALLPQTTTAKELEVHELQNGTRFTVKELNDLINEMPAEYFPMFPNTNPFFKLMFTLNGWVKSKPTDYIKPPCCALYIKQYIYGRFDREMLPTLLSKPNTIISGYIKKYKLFQYLNDEGRRIMQGYIEDAISVMKESTNWHEFELKYTKKYNLPVQLRCMN